MEKSFFAALMDNSFSTFITRRVATVLYSILVVLIYLVVLVSVVAGIISFINNGPIGLLVILAGVLGGFVALILIRLGFESAVALVLIAENTAKAKSPK
jgi:hypothetical protein